MELILWLDPDGLPREHIQEVFHQVSDEVMSIMSLVLNGTFDIESSVTPAYNWAKSLATMLHQAAKLDAQAAHAIGHMSIDQLEDLLVGFNTFLSSSDGLIPVTSQEDSAGEWSTHSTSREHRAHHLNVLQTPSVIEECCNFIAQILTTNPPDAVSILFITPSWLGEDSCNTISDGIRAAMNLPPSQIELFDFSVLETVNQTTIQSIDLSERSAADFQLLIPSLNIGNGSMRDALAQQVKKVVDFIIQEKGGKVFIIGHSVGGLAMRYYSEGWAHYLRSRMKVGSIPLNLRHHQFLVP